jgi:hypothetical protein
VNNAATPSKLTARKITNVHGFDWMPLKFGVLSQMWIEDIARTFLPNYHNFLLHVIIRLHLAQIAQLLSALHAAACQYDMYYTSSGALLG